MKKKEKQRKLGSGLANEEETNTANKKLSYEKFNYDKFEVVSSWIKEMRLGNVRRALYWLRIMMQSGEPLTYISRRLHMFSFEDCYGAEAYLVGLCVHEAQRQFGNLDHNPVLMGTLYFCRAKKFWEEKQAANDDLLWYQIKDDVAEVLKGNLSKRLPIPSYAVDQHTLKGKIMLSQGLKVDDRYSGTRRGRANMINEFRKFGKLVESEIPFI